MQIKSLIPYGHQEALVLDIETVLDQCRKIYYEPCSRYDGLAAYWVQTYYLAEVILFLPGAGEELTREANTLIYNLLDSKMAGKEFTEICNNFYKDGSIRRSLSTSFNYIEPDDKLLTLEAYQEIRRACHEFFSSIVSICPKFRSNYTFLFLFNFLTQFNSNKKFVRDIRGGATTPPEMITRTVQFDLMSGSVTSFCSDKGRASYFNNKLTAFVQGNQKLPVFQIDYSNQIKHSNTLTHGSAAEALSGFMNPPVD